MRQFVRVRIVPAQEHNHAEARARQFGKDARKTPRAATGLKQGGLEILAQRRATQVLTPLALATPPMPASARST